MDNVANIEINKRINKSPIEAVKPTERPLHTLEPRRTGAEVIRLLELERPIELRPYQIEALDALVDHRASGHHEALLHLATGLGKTNVAAMDIANFAYSRQQEGLSAPKVLFLAHQVALLDQAKERFSWLLPEMSSAQISTSSTDTPEDLKNAQVVFATLQSMKARKSSYEADTFDYMVVDESHHSMAEHFSSTIEYFTPEFRLGMTATPFRLDEKDLSDLFGETVYSKTLVDAIAEKNLVSPEYTIVADDIVRSAIEENFTSLKELNDAVFHERRNGEVARIIQEMQEKIRNPRTILFTGSIAHAEEIARLLPDAKTLHSQMSDEEQRQILRDFRSGNLPTVVTIDMFNEGVDIPEANLAVFLRSTGSRTIFEQQLGRVLRPSDGKDTTSVLDFVGTAERLKMLYDLSRDIRKKNDLSFNETGPEDDTAIATEKKEQAFSIPGSFEPNFTDEQIDIIARLRELTEKRNVLIPENYLTIGGLEKETGINAHTLNKIVEQLSITGLSLSAPNTQLATYYSTQQQELILNEINRIPKPPDNYYTVNKLSKTYAFDSTTIQRIIQQFGITGALYRTPRGIRIHYSPEEQSLILNELNKITRAPEGYMSAKALATYITSELEHPIAETGLHKITKQLSIDGTEFNSTGRVATYYSPADRESILNWVNNNLSNVPEGYRAANGFESVGPSVVIRYAEKLNITGIKFRSSNGKVGTYYSPEEQRLILNEANKIEKPQEGYLSANELAPLLATYPKKIRNTAVGLGITGTLLKTKNGNLGTFFSPEEQQHIKESLYFT